ncbi:MAG: hypothetical protein IT336_11765, partial [Thermomicrobiales bacterium]|nr:hypothetical protein [Thermomicrobiales bacterium]
MNVNFPNRAPVVARDSEIRVVRRLPGSGDVKIRAGERVDADHVLTRTDPASAAVRISVSDQLGVAPQEVVKHLMKPVGSAFGTGEALARNRKGLRNVVVASPVAGTLLSIDSDTGMALIAPGGAGDIRAMITGDVEFVDGKQSVSIRTVGSRLYGIVGLGGSVRGPLRVVASSPQEELQAGKINAELKGAIVVGGAWANAAAIKKLIEVGAAGLITGGFVDREVIASLGVAAEDRLAPWRMRPGDQAIGAEYTPGIAMMATEGFGPLAMHPEEFAFLQELDGANAVLFTPTRVVGYLQRPKLIVVNEEMLDDDAPSGTAMLSHGAKARLVDQNGLGQWVAIESGPRRIRRGDGNMVEVVDVRMGNDQSR